ncbi:MAG: carboxypeptidase regulatory-like domain-containing protein, partial [Phycisphaerae bacterium]
LAMTAPTPVRESSPLDRPATPAPSSQPALPLADVEPQRVPVDSPIDDFDGDTFVKAAHVREAPPALETTRDSTRAALPNASPPLPEIAVDIRLPSPSAPVVESNESNAPRVAAAVGTPLRPERAVGFRATDTEPLAEVTAPRSDVTGLLPHRLMDLHAERVAEAEDVFVSVGPAATESNVALQPAPLEALALPMPSATEQAHHDESTATVPTVEARPASVRPDVVVVELEPLDDSLVDVAPAPQTNAPSDEPIDVLAMATPLNWEARTNPPFQPTNAALLDDLRIDLIDPATMALHIPSESALPIDAYDQRAPQRRDGLLERMGGSDETERAVAAALKWLAAHQSADGRWDADRFDAACGGCGGETDVVADHALTGLSLICFLGAGHTHTSPGPYQDTLRRGLSWLISRQSADGDLRGPETMYTQGIASIALSEAYGMTGDLSLADPVRRAVDFIVNARNRRSGGWRYDPGQPGDTSVLGWQVMALKSARLTGIDVPEEAFDAARDWLDKVSSERHPGLYAYQPRRSHSPSMTAEGMFTQQLLGTPPSHPRNLESVAFILQHLPDWDAGPNTYYWYYATLGLFQHQGRAWETWNAAVTRELLAHQRRDGRAAGSWNPEGEWAPIGGRVYQTAICALTLEVYYRYLPLYGTPAEFAGPPSPGIGVIHGRVTDDRTAAPLRGVRVQLDLPDAAAVAVLTDQNGEFWLSVPDVPPFFAVSASHVEYEPAAVNVQRGDVIGQTLELDIALIPKTPGVIALEPSPNVHHLGNDRFEGRINSQFQRESEGLEFVAAFDVDAAIMPPSDAQAEIRFLAKGVQCPPRIRINGRRIRHSFSRSSRDGSFAEITISFDARLLEPGENTFEIRTQSCSGDLDDFEFINVRIHLTP